MREKHSSDEQTTVIRSHTITDSGLRLQYEVDNDLGHLVPRLRFIVDKDVDVNTMVSDTHTARTQILTRNMKPCVPVLASLENSPTDS